MIGAQLSFIPFLVAEGWQGKTRGFTRPVHFRAGAGGLAGGRAVLRQKGGSAGAVKKGEGGTMPGGGVIGIGTSAIDDAGGVRPGPGGSG